jgi:hypothetical protein
MRLYSVDWAHEEQKLAVYDGKKGTKTIPKLRAGDVIVAENIPAKLARKVWDMGAKILRCRPNDVSSFRDAEGWGKTDELDAILIWRLYESYPGLFREMNPPPPLTSLYATFKEIQKTRISMGNRLFAKEEATMDDLVGAMEAIERKALRAIEDELDAYPVWTEWMTKIRGVGPSIAGGVIGIIANVGISRFDTPSALWAYSGLSVEEDGRAPRREKGKASSYNPKLKTLLLGVLADSFVKQRTPVYRDIYDQEKARQLARPHPAGELAEKFNGRGKKYRDTDLNLWPCHAEKRARRKAAKVFLLHSWMVWRALEGLPLRAPWVLEKGGHTTFIEPPECPPRALLSIRETLLLQHPQQVQHPQHELVGVA